MEKVEVRPVLNSDLEEFCDFTVSALGMRRTAEEYQQGLSIPWCDIKPNNGFMLVKGKDIVGAIGAIYSSRDIRGHREHFCNIVGWIVLEEYRTKSLQLATALIRQEGFHFTDFTPTKVVSESLRFLNFKEIDAKQIRVPCNPSLRFKFSEISVVDNLKEIKTILEGSALDKSEAHAEIPWLRQIIVKHSGQQCLLILKTYEEDGDRVAALVGVCARENFVRLFNQIRHALATSCAIDSLRFEQRILGFKPRKSSHVQFAPRRMFLSKTLGEDDIDCLYSEVVALDLPTKLI